MAETPTTDQIRETYQSSDDGLDYKRRHTERGEEFDRWLADHDSELIARARRESALDDRAELIARARRESALDDRGVDIAAFTSDRDGAAVIEIDTNEGTGRVRIRLNEAVLFDADPDGGDGAS